MERRDRILVFDGDVTEIEADAQMSGQQFATVGGAQIRVWSR